MVDLSEQRPHRGDRTDYYAHVQLGDVPDGEISERPCDVVRLAEISRLRDLDHGACAGE